MADKQWSEFLDYVLPYANGAPRDIAEIEVKAACQDFLENTLALRSSFDEITLVASTPSYELTFESDGIGSSDQYEPVSFVPDTVRVGEYPMHETTEEELNQRVWNWRNESGGERPTHYFLDWNDYITVFPYPGSSYSGTYTLTGMCYVKPTQSATGVLQLVWNNYKEYIGYGATARILRSPHQRWSDIAAAEYFELQYRRGAAKVKAEVIRGKTRKSGMVRPPDTFLIA